MNINTINNIIEIYNNNFYDTNYSFFDINEIYVDKTKRDTTTFFLSNCISGDHLFDFLINNINSEIYAFDDNFCNYALTCLKIAVIIVCNEFSFKQIIFEGNLDLFEKKYNEIKFVMTNLFTEHARELIEYWDTHKRHIKNLHLNSRIGFISNLHNNTYLKTTIFWKKLINDMEKNGTFDKEYIELNKIKLFNEISNKWITMKEFNNFINIVKKDNFQDTLYYLLFGHFYKYKIPDFYAGDNYSKLKENIKKIHVSSKINYNIENLLYNNKIDYCLLKSTNNIPFYLIKNPYVYEFNFLPNNCIVHIESYNYSSNLNKKTSQTIHLFQMYYSYYMYKYMNYIDFLPNLQITLDKSIINNYLFESNRLINNFFKNEVFENKKILIISWDDFDSFYPIIFKNFNFENILVLSNDSVKFKNHFKKTIFEITESNLFDYIICNFALNLKKYRFKAEKFINKVIDLLKLDGKMMLVDLFYKENSYWDFIFSEYQMSGNNLNVNFYIENNNNCLLLEKKEIIKNTFNDCENLIERYVSIKKKN